NSSCSCHHSDVCDVSGVKLKPIGGRSGDLWCFLLKAGSALVPVIAVCWLEGGQVNARPHTGVVTQYARQSVDMFPWPARAPYLSLIEHIWEIIGRQLQRHPQALTVLYLPTKCNRHGTPSHKLRSGTGTTQCMHVCMLAFGILAVTPVINVSAFHI
ncbi:hypothetical protein AVEN_122459-1, partial [Araneus ventricosus]